MDWYPERLHFTLFKILDQEQYKIKIIQNVTIILIFYIVNRDIEESQSTKLWTIVKNVNR